jgi:two-component system, response regulator
MSKKILIIEDEKFSSEMYKIKFQQEGYEVATAGDGMEGYKLAQKFEPDLIFLDLVMPGMDGYQALDKLKSNEKTKGIKVYILSNLGQNEEIDRGIRGGADGYLVKANLTPTQLVKNVGKIFKGEKVGAKKITIAERDELKKTRVVSKKNEDNGFSLLLIEDEEAIVEMYKFRLEDEGYEVEVAKNGAWGLKLAKEKKFDVIIVDIVMPALNGYDAIKELKKGGESKDVPIIILSNSAQDKDVEKAKKLGATRYFLKSQITPARLKKEVEEILGKKD